MFKGLGDMGKMMKAAQEMQSKMAEATERMQSIEAEGSAGAGMVKAVATAQGEVKSLDVDPSLLSGAEDKEALKEAWLKRLLRWVAVSKAGASLGTSKAPAWVVVGFCCCIFLNA